MKSLILGFIPNLYHLWIKHSLRRPVPLIFICKYLAHIIIAIHFFQK